MSQHRVGQYTPLGKVTNHARHRRRLSDLFLPVRSDPGRHAHPQSICGGRDAAAHTPRLGLSEARSHLRPGDVLVVWKLDRLGRSVKGLVDFVGALAAEGVQFQSLTDGIDTTTPHGRFFFHLMAALAQMERELIVERTKAGLEAARQRGRVVGRKRRMTPSKIASAQQLLRSGMPPREVAHNLGVSIPTLYRWVPASSR